VAVGDCVGVAVGGGVGVDVGVRVGVAEGVAVGVLVGIVSVSVAELLPGMGSRTPLGALTVAVLESDPVAPAETVALAVYVTEPPTGRFTVSAMLPDPLAVQVPPPAPTHVQVAVSAAGNVSLTVAPETLLGPAFDAVIT
jgi:hypothetical protein